jgi:hypothetical protein
MVVGRIDIHGYPKAWKRRRSGYVYSCWTVDSPMDKIYGKKSGVTLNGSGIILAITSSSLKIFPIVKLLTSSNNLDST